MKKNAWIFPVAYLLASVPGSEVALAVIPPLNVGTWNVHPRSIGGQAPRDRIRAAATFGANHGQAILAFQEVPLTLLGNAAQLALTYNGTSYVALTMSAEYPSPSIAANTSPSGYLILYNPNVVTVAAGPQFFVPGEFHQLSFYQARPPVRVIFNVVNQNAQVAFFNWHNEAGSMAADQVVNLQHALSNHHPGMSWIFTGDFNAQVNPNGGVMADLIHSINNNQGGPSNWLGHNQGIDFILSSGQVTDNATANADANAQGLRSDGRHLSLFGTISL
jgi:hypothetical protein